MSSNKINIGKYFNIGKRIRNIRGKLTQIEFGNMMGLSGSVISKYESGRIPQRSILEKIANYGNTTVNWILNGDAQSLPDQKESAAQSLPAEAAPVDYKNLSTLSFRASGRQAAADDRRQFDSQLLSVIIALLEDICEESRIRLSPAQKGQAIAKLYEVHQDTVKPVTRQTVIAFIDLYR